MPALTRYRILENPEPEELAAEVGRYLAEGWSLRGDVQISVTDHCTECGGDRLFWYAQVVTK